MISKNLTVVNPSGLHLRPAGVLSQAAMKFKCDITIQCGEKKIVAKSVLNVMAAGIKKGTRSGLWLEYARLIGEIRPKYVIIENVRGLLARGIEIVLQDLAEIGYDAECEVLSAAALGAPHRR